MKNYAACNGKHIGNFFFVSENSRSVKQMQQKKKADRFLVVGFVSYQHHAYIILAGCFVCFVFIKSHFCVERACDQLVDHHAPCVDAGHRPRPPARPVIVWTMSQAKAAKADSDSKQVEYKPRAGRRCSLSTSGKDLGELTKARRTSVIALASDEMVKQAPAEAKVSTLIHAMRKENSKDLEDLEPEVKHLITAIQFIAVI